MLYRSSPSTTPREFASIIGSPIDKLLGCAIHVGPRVLKRESLISAMLRIPRDTDAKRLISALRTLGYEPSRQVGSHIRLTTARRGGHHVTVPNHNPLRLGTLSAIIKDVAAHNDLTRDEVVALIVEA